jgi:hypothetical protein
MEIHESRPIRFLAFRQVASDLTPIGPYPRILRGNSGSGCPFYPQRLHKHFHRPHAALSKRRRHKVKERSRQESGSSSLHSPILFSTSYRSGLIPEKSPRTSWNNRSESLGLSIAPPQLARKGSEKCWMTCSPKLLVSHAVLSSQVIVSLLMLPRACTPT